MVQALTAQERKNKTKSSIRTLRKKGNLPAVVYGGKLDSTPIIVDLKALKKIIMTKGRNSVIKLKLNDGQHNVMIKDYQYDSLKSEYIHIDFFVVNLSEMISATVPLKLTGIPKGVKEDKGILQQAIYELHVTAKPHELPDSFEVDVTDLAIGDTLTVNDVTINQEIEVNQEAEEVVASVLIPKIEEESSEEIEAEEQEEELV